MTIWDAQQRRKSPDTRWRALALAVVIIAAGGLAVAAVSDSGLFTRGHSAGGASPDVRAHAGNTAQQEIHQRFQQEIHQRFQQGVVMLHAKRYEHAMVAFHRVLELDRAMPEAHVNMGFALIGLERYGAARDFFESAIALRKQQVNAYYGLAVALDGLRDRPGAIGAMRTFVHLSRPEDPHVRKARAALWEWEAGRIAKDSP